jgi:nucleotide-binding universal stress UspA family protein
MEGLLYKHILLPTDGSDLAMLGVTHGLQLAKDQGSKVTVVTVTPPYPLQSPTTHGAWEAAHKHDADKALDAARQAAKAADMEVSAVHEVAESPAEAIVEISKRQGCDLIVMASHGRRGVRRLLIGSQTAEVVQSSAIPILVIRH